MRWMRVIWLTRYIFRITGSLEINLIVGYRKISIYLILDAGLVRTGSGLLGNQSPFKKRAQSRFTFRLTSTGLIRMRLWLQISNHFGLSLSKRENGPPSSGPVLRQHEDCFLVLIISGMTAIDLEAHNGLGNEREGATMGLEVYQEVKTIHGLFRKA